MREKGNGLLGKRAFPVTLPGIHLYTVIGWVDRFKTWRADLKKRIAAGQDISVDLQIGAELIDQAAQRASGDDGAQLLVTVRKVLSGDSAAAAFQNSSSLWWSAIPTSRWRPATNANWKSSSIG